jgi:hypothetical protein
LRTKRIDRRRKRGVVELISRCVTDAVVVQDEESRGATETLERGKDA